MAETRFEVAGIKNDYGKAKWYAIVDNKNNQIICNYLTHRKAQTAVNKLNKCIK